MRSAVQHGRHRWPLLLVGGVAVLCASTALANRSVPASALRAALTTSPAASPTATPAALPAATCAVDPTARPAAGFSVDLSADLAPSPFHPLTGDQGTVHAVADGDGVIAESYLVRPDGTVQIYGSDRTPPRLVLGRVRPLVGGPPQTLQLVFSEDVQATGTTAVALSGPGGTPHPLTLDPAPGRVWTATLDPTLVPGDAFILTVSGVEDLAGNQILPQSLPFVAPEPALGLVLPGTAEADLLAVLDGPTGLALVLGTPVDPGAIPAGLVSVKRAGLAVAGSVSVHTGGAQPLEGAVLMWTPTDPQAYQPGACEVTIAAGLVDLAGHPIHGPPDAIAYDHSGQGDVVWARPEDAPILSASQVGNDRFLHGRPLIATLGLYDHRARFYDPTTQTFLEPDPLGPVDSPNLYQAFGLDPQNNTDPLGLLGPNTDVNDEFRNPPPLWRPTGQTQGYPFIAGIGDALTGLGATVTACYRGFFFGTGRESGGMAGCADAIVSPVIDARFQQAAGVGGSKEEAAAVALSDLTGVTLAARVLTGWDPYTGPVSRSRAAGELTANLGLAWVAGRVLGDATATPRTAAPARSGLDFLVEAERRIALSREACGDAPAYAMTCPSGQSPLHHLATNKNSVSTAGGGPYTPKFEALFEGAGMTLEDALNKLRIPGHSGPHPEANRVVYQRLSGAVEGLQRGTEAYRAALQKELEVVGLESATPGNPLNVLLQKGRGRK